MANGLPALRELLPRSMHTRSPSRLATVRLRKWHLTTRRNTARAVKLRPSVISRWAIWFLFAERKPARTPGKRRLSAVEARNFAEGMGKRFIAGEIKSIDGTQLTIQRPDGVTQKISVDEDTSFRKNGESITLADLKPGDHVSGRGELKNDVFVPAVLNVGQPKFGMQGQNEAPAPH
jgi:hypothetical protein